MPFDVESPVLETQLAQLDDQPTWVQFSSALSSADYQLLGEWSRDHPQVMIRAYAYDGSISDLDFLRWFPETKRFAVDVYRMDNFDGLKYLPENLESLVLGATHTRISMRPLERFKELRRLYVEGHTKDLDAVGQLTSLVDLTLRSIKLPNLEILRPLEQLEALDLKLGGTTNLEPLSSIGRLKYVELWQIRGFADLTPVSELTTLEYLFLQSLRRVETLPDLSRLINLGCVWIETMKGLTDLAPLTTAPALEDVGLIDMGHLPVDALAPLLNCPQLKTVCVGLGSDRKNRVADEILGSLSDRDSDLRDRSAYRHW